MNDMAMESARSGNFGSCCRLCLMDNFNSLKPIFDDATESQGLVERILAFLEIEISANDKFSTMICMNCVEKVDNWCNFKLHCNENQAKLHGWMKQWNHNSSDLSVSIKEEPVDEVEEEDQPEHVLIENYEPEVLIKPEPMDEDIDIGPPSLTPHPPELSRFEELSDEAVSTISEIDGSSEVDNACQEGDIEGRKCYICNKLFSTPGNRRKHEKTIHKRTYTKFKSSTGHMDEDSQVSIVLSENSSSQDKVTVPLDNGDFAEPSQEVIPDIKMKYSESDIRKIQFAAGLQLVQRNGTPNEISSLIGDSPLTKVEDSYISKCRKMVTMFNTLICACHGYQHKTSKRLFAHLRSLCSWFPIYTCYNCIITFTDRSSNMKHNAKCPNMHLANLIKLSELRRLDEIRIRLYQFFKCVQCNYVFAFHDDYRDHVDLEHSATVLPVTCLCGTIFEDAHEYKKHIYKSCMVHFYCDICFGISPTLGKFKKHCEETHDHVDGFQFLTSESSSVKQDYDEPESSFEHFAQDEGETIECAPDLQLEGLDHEAELEKLVSPNSVKNWYSKTACPICGKVYSNYHNMLRHFKTHDESEKTIPCPHCIIKFRLKSELKEHLIIDHGIVELKSSPGKVNSFPCQECAIVFTSFDEWYRHKGTHGPPFCCDECDKQLESQDELDQHRSVHLNIKVFRDSKTQSYRSAMLSPNSKDDDSDMAAELLPLEDKKPAVKKYHCLGCNKTYSGYGGLWEHNKRYHPDRRPSKDYPRKCKYCDKILQSGGAYYMHKQMHERYTHPGAIKEEPGFGDDSNDEESYHTCNKCFKVFSSKSNLKSHMKSHGVSISPSRMQMKLGRVKRYWCDICHQPCHGFEELQKHKEEHENENMPDLPNEVESGEEHVKSELLDCDICDKLFNTKLALRRHKEKHLEDMEDDCQDYVFCKYCKIPFLTDEAVIMHIDMEHVDTMPRLKQKYKHSKKYPCTLCKKLFDTTGALSSHQGWHKRVKLEQKMMHKQKARLIPMSSSMISKFECGTCSLIFVNDTALQIHILEAHRNINATLINPRCGMCEIDLESQSAYEKHMELHKIVEKQSEKKAFSCKFCMSSFSRSDVLNAHIRTHHKELLVDGHKCGQCDRVFEKQTSLHIHMKVHERHRTTISPPKTGKFLYTCSICHTGFNIPKELRNHIIAAHPF